jgi:hypothetical protein
MNPNYTSKVHEDLDCLLDVGFIILVGLTKWLSPIIIVPKKNGKLHICVDYMWLNIITKKNPYPLSFIDDIMDFVDGKELYSFLDKFNGYNQVNIRAKDREKIVFIIEWGTSVFTIMPFGLCNAFATFQQVITKAFHGYIGEFM